MSGLLNKQTPGPRPLARPSIVMSRNANFIATAPGVRLSWTLLSCLLLVGLVSQLATCFQLQQATSHESSRPPSLTQASQELKRFEEWRRNPLYVPPFEPKVLGLPEFQVAFIRNMTGRDLVLFREIVDEAIRIRNKWTPSVKLMFKYAGRLIRTFIKNRRDEQKIELRVEPRPDFFVMIADLVQSVIDRSGSIKNEKGYSKDSVEDEPFRGRVFALFDYVQRIVNASPLAAYHKWTELRLFQDEPKNPLHGADTVEEAADLLAQFRAMGYESTVFVGRRIVSMLRLFGRGVVPSSEDEV